MIHASGAELADTFRKHAEHFKAEFRETDVKGITVVGGRKVIHTDGDEIEAEAVIIATGASFKKLGAPGEKEFTGRGSATVRSATGPFSRTRRSPSSAGAIRPSKRGST